MPDELLTVDEAARRLGVTRTTLYGWLGLSRRSLLAFHGRPATIEFFQTGPKGQGRIQIDAKEIERVMDLMRVKPLTVRQRRSPVPRRTFPHITVPLGRPGDLSDTSAD